MKTLILAISLFLFSTSAWAADYTVRVPAALEPVLSSEAAAEGLTNAELVQSRIDGYLAERSGHYNTAKARLDRLTDAEKSALTPAVRQKLGL